ncbi:hypothetical protein FEM48_ZijujUnG0050400 [Ziziphus jujuba var. spinosa]|uniref:RNA-binding protein 48 n=1 Tax=Ziziphus jujuba var. spinosa TaxID=714518 RepID=A0A978U943_ZIZJJ|nr:hypothetical protein FEM48_ZijujUnG0050400 [Ziziphus jujuba var. spinosa]
MRRYKDEPPAVRVYTVCDESRYLIVRNIPALGCGDELLKLFSSYGDVEECKPMDAEDCEEFTDVYWIKFRLVSNSRVSAGLEVPSRVNNTPITRVSSDKEYFPSQSMNQTVRFVREKLDKIQSSGQQLQDGPASKKTRIDNRRRI